MKRGMETGRIFYVVFQSKKNNFKCKHSRLGVIYTQMAITLFGVMYVVENNRRIESRE